jgi:hypothetical protein
VSGYLKLWKYLILLNYHLSLTLACFVLPL